MHMHAIDHTPSNLDGASFTCTQQCTYTRHEPPYARTFRYVIYKRSYRSYVHILACTWEYCIRPYYSHSWLHGHAHYKREALTGMAGTSLRGERTAGLWAGVSMDWPRSDGELFNDCIGALRRTSISTFWAGPRRGRESGEGRSTEIDQSKWSCSPIRERDWSEPGGREANTCRTTPDRVWNQLVGFYAQRGEDTVSQAAQAT